MSDQPFRSGNEPHPACSGKPPDPPRPSAASRARIDLDYLHLSSSMREELLRFHGSLKPTHLYILHSLIVRTFDRGASSLFMPGPANALAGLIEIDEKDTAKALNAL